MRPRTWEFTQTEERIVEQLVIDDPEVMINHVVLPEGEMVPEHTANANVHLVVTRGRLHLQLDGEISEHGMGTIVEVPRGTRMKISNEDEPTTEFFVIKTPAPGTVK